MGSEDNSLEYATLDELSRLFAEKLFDRFPEWKSYGRVVADKTGDVLEVHVPQPEGDSALHISTWDGEITIGFDMWHTHIGPYLGLDVSESIADAISTLESFVAEETVVKVEYKDGAWARSRLDDRKAPSELRRGLTTKFLSWRHTFDRVVEIP
jgi:hypothetical protein